MNTLYQMTEEFDALATQPSMNQNQCSIINAAHLKINQNTEKTSQSWPNAIVLIKDIILMKRDTNSLMEAQSAIFPDFSDDCDTENILTVQCAN